MRRLAARAHLWGGLVSGPLLLVLGLSGSVLVFAPEIERVTNATPTLAASAAAPRSLDAVVAAALFAQPGAEPRVLRVPARAAEPFVVELAVAGHRLDVAVDPSTLRVVDTRAPERSVLPVLRSLHGALHAGRVGAILVALLGLWLVVEGMTGVWLYGPSVARRVRGRNRAVHRIVGACALVIGAVVGVTGTLLALAGVTSAASAADASRRLPSLDVIAARVAMRGQIVAFVAEPAHRVRVDTRARDGRLESVVLDGDGGIATGVSRHRTAWDVVHALHAGDFAGWASRLLYVAVGLALPVLSVTGFFISTRAVKQSRRASG
jgi:uncharacterized iron-regulated membrane protein